MDGGAKCEGLEEDVARVSSDFGRDDGIGDSVGVGACVDEVDKIWLVSGSALEATTSEFCCSLTSRGWDNVATEVTSCGAAVTTAVGGATVRRELKRTGLVGGVMSGL